MPSVRGVRGCKPGRAAGKARKSSSQPASRAGGAHRGLSMSAKPSHSGDANRKSDTSMSAGDRAGGAVRSKQTVNRINMYKSKALKWQHGKLVGKGIVHDAVAKNKAARVQPDRRWFGNTRTVKQDELDRFREEIAAKAHDPYTVLLKRKQLPMGLLTVRVQALLLLPLLLLPSPPPADGAYHHLPSLCCVLLVFVSLSLAVVPLLPPPPPATTGCQGNEADESAGGGVFLRHVWLEVQA